MHSVLLSIQVHLLARLHRAVAPLTGPRGGRGHQRGQSTAEYALVLLGASTVALVFLAWAGRTSRIEDLFNAVLDTVIGKV